MFPLLWNTLNNQHQSSTDYFNLIKSHGLPWLFFMALLVWFQIGALCQFVYTAGFNMRHIVAFLPGGGVLEMRLFL